MLPGVHLFQALFQSTCLLLLLAAPVVCKLPEGQGQARPTHPSIYSTEHRAWHGAGLLSICRVNYPSWGIMTLKDNEYF